MSHTVFVALSNAALVLASIIADACISGAGMYASYLIFGRRE